MEKEKENKKLVDVEKLVSMANKERKTYEKQDNKVVSEPMIKKKKLIIREQINAPESIILLQPQPILSEHFKEMPRYNETFIEVL